LACAGQAEQVTCVDVSQEAVKTVEANAARNGLTNVEAVEANVFDYLRARDKDNQRYHMVVLDPPAFAKNKGEVEGALRGYKEINLRAMKLLEPGGILFTCSCSHHVDDAMFDRVLMGAAADAKRTFRVTASPDQPLDHPIRLGFPESRYLKTRVLTALD
jgi:23S rRNA (cytosine1962-C5)-methyltransferase